jgi:hypothetical protein
MLPNNSTKAYLKFLIMVDKNAVIEANSEIAKVIVSDYCLKRECVCGTAHIPGDEPTAAVADEVVPKCTNKRKLSSKTEGEEADQKSDGSTENKKVKTNEDNEEESSSSNSDSDDDEVGQQTESQQPPDQPATTPPPSPTSPETTPLDEVINEKE